MQNLECLKCGRKWFPRIEATPRQCPSCKSVNWNKPRLTEDERFNIRVNKDGRCWGWTGAKNRAGYGVFSTKTSQSRLAHRIMWEKEKGAIPQGMQILHHCDNSSCVNPDHLFVGSQKDNMDDMANKGRKVIVTGEQNGMAKLTKSQVKEIRLIGKSLSLRRVAALYNVSYENIRLILNKKTWE